MVMFILKYVFFTKNCGGGLKTLGNHLLCAGRVLQHPYVVGGVRWQDTHSNHFEATPSLDRETDFYPDNSEANQSDASGVLAS